MAEPIVVGRVLLDHSDDSRSEIQAANNEVYGLMAMCLGLTMLAAGSFFYVRRKSPALVKRQPELVLWAVVHTCLVFIAVGFQICFSQDRRWHIYKRNPPIFPLMFWVVSFNNACANWITVFRCHFIWFHLGLAEALEDMEWKLHIDEQSKRTNFYLRYRELFGNKLAAALYCSFWVVLIPMAGAVTLAVNDYEPSNLSRMWIALGTWLPMIHIALIWFSMPKYQDLFHFRTELQIVCTLTIFYGSLHFGWATLTQPRMCAKDPGTVEYVWWLFFPTPFMVARIMSQTTLVQYLNDLPLTPWQVAREVRTRLMSETKEPEPEVQTLALSLSSSNSDENRRTNNQGKPSPSLTALSSKVSSERSVTMPPIQMPAALAGGLASISTTAHSGTLFRNSSIRDRAGTTSAPRELLFLFADDQGLRLLCRHVAREFAIENVLFLIETSQNIESMQSEFAFDLNAERIPLDLTLARNAPKSAIVFKMQGIGAYERTLMIFDKYLRSQDQITELNVSFLTRQDAYSKFGYEKGEYVKMSPTGTRWATTDTAQAALYLKERMSINELFHVFDAPRKEAFNLIRESFARLTRTPEYGEWLARNQTGLSTPAGSPNTVELV